jgi:eukaryotic-like serine/threonine-protein kinase
VGPGDVIAERYRVERLLGRGGMGSVWAATHLVTNKPVALKVLRREDDDETARRRVLREARAACAVRHPHVVDVHDVIEASDGSPVLVMDLLDGEPLRARLDRDRTLPVAEVVRIAETVLDALDAAHAAGIVHRDLKPDNLFLLRDGRLMLLDFGVAKLVAKDAPAAGPGTLTATGAMVGTPFYMAPEQAFGEPIDGRADLWAAGIVMFECLAGAPPTRGDNLGQVLRILSTGKIPKLHDRAPDVPAPIAALVDAMISIEPGDRPATARDARGMLRAASDATGEGAKPAARAPASTRSPKAPALSSPPPAATTDAAMVLPRRSRSVAIAAAVGLTGGVLVAIAIARGPRSRAASAEPRATSAPLAMEPQAAPSPAPSAPAPPRLLPFPSVSTTPTASSSGPAPRVAKPAKGVPSSSAPAPSAAPSSTAPRLLTDVPF